MGSEDESAVKGPLDLIRLSFDKRIYVKLRHDRELHVEDHEMLRDVSKRKLTPGISKSQEFKALGRYLSIGSGENGVHLVHAEEGQIFRGDSELVVPLIQHRIIVHMNSDEDASPSENFALEVICTLALLLYMLLFSPVWQQ